MNVILWISFLGLIFLCLNSIHFLLSLENIYVRITLSVIYAFSLSIILSGSLFRPYRETRWIFVKKGLFYELLVFSGIVLGGILLDLWFMPEFYDIDNKQWFSRSTLYVVSLI